jgi:putative peptidoglycan lipid II flippase
MASEPLAERSPASTGAPVKRNRAVALMASGTLVSRLLGFVRTFMLAIAIGSVSSVADAFEKANTVPTIIFMLLAGGIFNVVLVPQLIKASKADDRGGSYTSKLITLTVVVMGLATLLLTLASPFILRALSSGWSPDLLRIGTIFTYWCMPQVFFYGLYAVLGQVLNAHGRFGAYMWAPVANNVLQLIMLGLFILVFGGYEGTPSTQLREWDTAQTVLLAGGATLGIAVQALVLIWPLRRLGLRLRADFSWRGIGLKHVGKMAAWTLAAMIIGNLTNLYFGKLVSAATEARKGMGSAAASVPGEAALNISQLITVLPHSIFALSLATVLFNELSHAFTDHRRHEVGAMLNKGLRTTAVPIMFFTVGFIVLAGPLGRLFGGTAPHTANDAGAAIGILIALTALGLPAKSYTFFLQRTFYAQEDTRTPMLIQSGYAVLGLALASAAAVTVPATQIAYALAIIYSITNVAQALMAHWAVKRNLGSYGATSVMDAYIRIGVMATFSGAAGAVVLWLLGGFDFGYAWSGYMPAIISIVLTGLTMGAIYLFLLRFARVSELEDFMGPLARRLPGRPRR